MTVAVLLRSRVMRKYQAPFWRAVEEVTLSLTLLNQKSAILVNHYRTLLLALFENKQSTNVKDTVHI